MPYRPSGTNVDNQGMDNGPESTTDARARAEAVTDRFTDLSPEQAKHLGPVDACPECGGHDFTMHNRDDWVVFVCAACGSSWRDELSYVRPVAET
jgi:hypothetical protein